MLYYLNDITPMQLRQFIQKEDFQSLKPNLSMDYCIRWQIYVCWIHVDESRQYVAKWILRASSSGSRDKSNDVYGAPLSRQRLCGLP